MTRRRGRKSFGDWKIDLDSLCRERLKQTLDDIPQDQLHLQEMRGYWVDGHSPMEFFDEIIIGCDLLDGPTTVDNFDLRFDL